MDHTGFDTAVIGGLSLGGYMSLAFHHEHPDRVRGLLIIDTGPGFKNDQAREAWNAYAVTFAEDLAEHGLAALADQSREQATATHRSAEGLALAARHMLTQHDATVIESLPAIAVPTLVLVGHDDEPFLNATDYMAAEIPGARKVVLPDAGHASNLDQPDAFNTVVEAFLADNDL